MDKNIKEEDLYLPVKNFLEDLGYKTRAEVKGCDIAARRDDELLAVELKKVFNLKLVYQAMDRKSITESVYVAIPRPKGGQKAKPWKNMVKLLKKLGIGLMTVALDSPLRTVDIIIEPDDGKTYKNSRKRSAVKKELERRRLDGNKGGVTRKKILTAYKEREIELCCLLKSRGAVSVSELKELGYGEYYPMLYRNYSRFFAKESRGIYKLSQTGEEFLESGEFADAVKYYTDAVKK